MQRSRAARDCRTTRTAGRGYRRDAKAIQRCVLLGAFAALVGACSGDVTTSLEKQSVIAPRGPSFLELSAANGPGECMGDDAAKWPVTDPGAWVKGFKENSDPESFVCNAKEVFIATATVTQVFDPTANGGAGGFVPYDAANPPQCVVGEDITFKMTAVLQQHATSERGDIGVWIATDGGNAKTGDCNQYNVPTNATGVGVLNTDGDQCAGLGNEGQVAIDLGELTVPCNPSDDNKLLVGSCIGWKVANDQVEPDDASCADNKDGTGALGTGDDFRAGTLPTNKTKCNCEPFELEIVVVEKATIEVKKTCSPTSDNGTFDLEINDVIEKNDATCAGGAASTTGAVEVGAGTSGDPGADHTVAESGFTFANYTSTVSCTKNGLAYIASQAYTAPNNLDVHVEPDDVIVCTFVNTRKGGITIVKNTVPDGPTDFAFTSNITGNTAFTLDDDGDNANTFSNTKSITNVAPGQYTVTETAVSGFDLHSITCSDANSSGVIATGVATINVEAGESVTCTYVNKQRGQINIVKQTDPDAVSGSFSFAHTVGTNSDPQVTTPFLLSDGGTQQILLVKPGSYTVTEALLAGFDLVASGAGFTTGCTDPTTNSSIVVATRIATINVAPGETVTCTFVNRQRASLIINKTENGGLPLTRAWAFELRTGTSTTQAGSLVASASAVLATGVVTFPGTFVPGAYQLCETGMPATWTNNFTGFTPLGATPEGGDNSTECINITLVSGANGPGGLTGVPNPIDNELPPPPSGDARTIGYWKNWNSCSNSSGKQYQKALGLNEWNKTLDGNLPQTIGDLVLAGAPGANQPAVGCLKAVRILNKSDVNNGKKMASDPAYNLAAQLLAAKLNYTAGATQCTDATNAINAAQALLDLINFNGTGPYKNVMTAAQQTQANTLAGTLDSYNNNNLCPVVP